jgi:hypothetical protein
MIGNPRERWQLLCEQAAKELNSAKLLAMVREISDLIDAKYGRARPGLGPGAGSTWSPLNTSPGSTSSPRNTGMGSTWSARNTGPSSICSPRNFSSLTSPKICAVTRPSSGETQ